MIYAGTVHVSLYEDEDGTRRVQMEIVQDSGIVKLDEVTIMPAPPPPPPMGTQIDRMQEVFGYLLSNDTRAQKIVLVQGAPGAGKSVMSQHRPDFEVGWACLNFRKHRRRRGSCVIVGSKNVRCPCDDEGKDERRTHVCESPRL